MGVKDRDKVPSSPVATLVSLLRVVVVALGIPYQKIYFYILSNLIALTLTDLKLKLKMKC